MYKKWSVSDNDIFKIYDTDGTYFIQENIAIQKGTYLNKGTIYAYFVSMLKGISIKYKDDFEPNAVLFILDFCKIFKLKPQDAPIEQLSGFLGSEFDFEKLKNKIKKISTLV